MNIYFTASISGKSQNEKHYRMIVDHLVSQGAEVTADHILNESKTAIQEESKEALIRFQHNLEGWIQKADGVVAEVSHPSTSVGYEVSLAQRFGKPILLLYHEGYPPSLLSHHHDDKLICEHYASGNVSGLLDDFINYIKGVHDTRFTFFITPEIARFLEDISRKRKVPKSVYLRSLIEREMK